MKNALKFLPLLLFLPLLASGQKRLNEVGAVYGAIRSMTPEAYKEAHDKYGIRWIEAWTGNLTGGTEEQYDAWIERFNNAMKGSGLKLWSVHLPFTRKAPNDLSDDRPEWREATFKNWIEILDRATRLGKFPDIKICYDTNHLLGEESHAFAERFAPYIANIHVSDYDGVDERHWMPGRGIVEWPKVIDILMRSGYDGPFMYEVTPRNDPRGSVEYMRQTTDSLFTRYALYKKQRAGEK